MFRYTVGMGTTQWDKDNFILLVSFRKSCFLYAMENVICKMLLFGYFNQEQFGLFKWQLYSTLFNQKYPRKVNDRPWYYELANYNKLQKASEVVKPIIYFTAPNGEFQNLRDLNMKKN